MVVQYRNEEESPVPPSGVLEEMDGTLVPVLCIVGLGFMTFTADNLYIVVFLPGLTAK